MKCVLMLVLLKEIPAKDKRQHLLDVWNGSTKAASKFCVESTVKAEDEWLHSFFYFNDDIPAEMDFEKAIGDFLTFEFSMIMRTESICFSRTVKNMSDATNWESVPFVIYFHLNVAKEKNMALLKEGDIPHCFCTQCK